MDDKTPLSFTVIANAANDLKTNGDRPSAIIIQE